MSPSSQTPIAVGLHLDHNAGMAAVQENSIIFYCEFERLTRVKNQIGWFPNLVADSLERLGIKEIGAICTADPEPLLELLSTHFDAVQEAADVVAIDGHRIEIHGLWDVVPYERHGDVHPLMHVLAALPLDELCPDIYAVLIFDAEQPRFSWIDLRTPLVGWPDLKFRTISEQRWFNGEIFEDFYGKLFYGSQNLSHCGKLMGLSSWGRTRTLYMEWLCEVAQRHFDPTGPSWLGYRGASKDTIIQDITKLVGVDPRNHEHPKVLDLAASAQEVFTHNMMAQVMVGFESVCEELRQKDMPLPAGLIYGGGCALSVVSNALLREMLDLPIIIPPYAHDASQFLGTAIAASLRSNFAAWSPGGWHGIPAHTFGQVNASMITNLGVPTRTADPKEVATRIAAGELIGLIEGGSEAGPRALGKRSLLANPLDATMRDRLNRDVKRREWYRPFAPAILAEAFPRYFGEPASIAARYMLDMYRIVPQYRGLLSSVSGPDGTSRPQAVHIDLSPWYHSLLVALEQQTGHPIVLNTSLNAPGLPIAFDLRQGLEDCIALGADAAVIDGLLIEKDAIAHIVARGHV